MPKRGNPSWVLFGSFSQRERTINNTNMFHQSSRQSPCLQHQRCRSTETPPLRRRPKGFPVALWKPSDPSGWRERNKHRDLPVLTVQSTATPSPTSMLLRRGDSASAEAAKGLSGRPLETFGSLRLEGKEQAAKTDCFIIMQPMAASSLKRELFYHAQNKK